MRPNPLLWVLLGALALGSGLVGPGAVSVFTNQAQNPGNTFTTAASFDTATPTPTATATATATATPTATPTPSCTAGNTGLLDPSAQAADTGGNGNGFELNPTNAFADGAGYATNIGNTGDRHRIYDYGIVIPAGCSVKGIEVRADWWLDNAAGTNSMSVELSWDGGNSWTAAKTDALETTTEHTALLGGSADTWGRTWTVAETTNANFRVRVTCNSTNARGFLLDWIPVTVYYGP